MSFSRLGTSIIHTYFKHNLPLKFAGNLVHNLGFMYTRSLYPDKHIEAMCSCCKAFKFLVFIFWISQEFNVTPSLKALYCPRSLIEYYSVICDQLTFSHKIWSIEHREKCFNRLLLLNITNVFLVISLLTNEYYPLAAYLIADTWQTFHKFPILSRVESTIHPHYRLLILKYIFVLRVILSF